MDTKPGSLAPKTKLLTTYYCLFAKNIKQSYIKLYASYIKIYTKTVQYRIIYTSKTQHTS